MSAPTEPVPSTRVLAAVKLWLANLALAIFVGTAYIAHIPETDSPRARTFAVLALISSMFLITVPPGIALVLAARWVRRPRLLGSIQAFVWIALQILLFTDTRVFNIFGYHFFESGHVWNLMVTRGSEDAVHLGWQVGAAIVAGLGLGFSIEYLLWRIWLRREEAIAHRPTVLRVLLHPGIVTCALIIPIVGVEKTIYAWADLSEDREVTKLAQLFPLYPHIAAKDLAEQVFGPEAFPDGTPATPRIEADDPDQSLNYPLLVPEVNPDGPRPNVLIVAIDCWRRDMLGPETTPHLWSFADECLRFDDHLSGGNSTRFGLFSMLYGLHGSYWFPVLEERRAPVLIDVLRAEGYDLRVFSAASQHYPELRDTAWVDFQDDVYDDFPGEEAWERDRQAADAFEDWIGGRAQGGEESPFFSFVLIDSPHPVYSFPPGTEHFTPSAQDLNYLALSDKDGPDPALMDAVKNRYMNAVLHADEIVASILNTLRATGELDDTLLLITGDHGEEFLDNGFFGHTSNFTDAQIAVPLLLRAPGVTPDAVDRPTSHLDVPATILEMLGADPADRGGWTLGASLLDEGPVARHRVASGWKELGLVTPDGDPVLNVPLHDRWSFAVDVYDASWRFQIDGQAAVERELPALKRVAEECRRFLL